MARATDKTTVLDIVEHEYPDLLQTHRELLDRDNSHRTNR